MRALCLVHRVMLLNCVAPLQVQKVVEIEMKKLPKTYELIKNTYGYVTRQTDKL